MNRLAEAIELAAKISEESYDREALDKALESGKVVDFNAFYAKSLLGAAKEAAKKVGLDPPYDEPIRLLLKYSWTDILAWAKGKLSR